jgi:hypothetical protein
MIGLMMKSNLMKKRKELTGSGIVLTALSISLLNCKASTEGASDSVVAASDSADGTGRCSLAVEVLRHLDVDDKVLFLGLRKTETSGDVVRDLEWGEGGYSVAGLVHIALEGTGAVSVDLVNSDGQHGAC